VERAVGILWLRWRLLSADLATDPTGT